MIRNIIDHRPRIKYLGISKTISIIPFQDFLVFIFEFKHTKDINADLDSLANSALKQIEDMKYDTELNDFGVEDIVKIGIAFRQKSAVVKRG